MKEQTRDGGNAVRLEEGKLCKAGARLARIVLRQYGERLTQRSESHERHIVVKCNAHDPLSVTDAFKASMDHSRLAVSLLIHLDGIPALVALLHLAQLRIAGEVVAGNVEGQEGACCPQQMLERE